jgi:hypothetical protein
MPEERRVRVMGQRTKPRRKADQVKRPARDLRIKCAAPDGGKRFDRVGLSRATVRAGEKFAAAGKPAEMIEG